VSGQFRIALVLSALTAAGCWQFKHCQMDNDCGSGNGLMCDTTTKMCTSAAAGAGGAGGQGGRGGAGGVHDAGAMDAPVPCTASSCTEVTKPICAPHDGPVAACEACTDTTQCTALGTSKPACKKATGACVICVDNTTCAGTTPVCDTATNTCTKCVSDSDCAAAPGVCMGDGHCASAGEVIFVQYSASGCPNADGTAAKPYCTLGGSTGGVQALSSARTALVVVGPANDQLALATSGFAPLIVGRANSGMPGSIGASVAAAISVSSDNVQIRDIAVTGTTSSANGIIATGNGTKLTLTRVTVSIPKGLAIDAETGVTLTMASCTVSNSAGGGILLNGAAFDIENTTVTNNGPGSLQTSAATVGGIFVNDTASVAPVVLKQVTVTGNMGPGIACLNAITGTGLLVYGNSTPQIGANCGSGISTCGDAGTTTCGAQQ